MILEQHFNTYIAEHSGHLYSYAISRLHDEEMTLDVLQETYLAAWKGNKNFRGDCTVRTWLTAILRNKINDHIKILIRDRNLAADFQIELNLEKNSPNNIWIHSTPESNNNPETQLNNQQLLQSLMFCINKLPENQKAVFLMRELGNNDTPTICQLCEISPGNVHVLLHRAKSALKGHLETHWFNQY